MNVRDLIGKDAQIQIVDSDSGGGAHPRHQITFADAPAHGRRARSGLDYGRTTTRRSPGTTSRATSAS